MASISKTPQAMAFGIAAYFVDRLGAPVATAVRNASEYVAAGISNTIEERTRVHAALLRRVRARMQEHTAQRPHRLRHARSAQSCKAKPEGLATKTSRVR